MTPAQCRAALLTALLSLPSFAAAAELTGDNLNSACSSQTATSGDLACNAFIAGFAAGVVAQRLLQIQGYAICLPEGSALVPSRKGVQAYLDAHPELLATNAADLAGAALFEAFPCPR
jgi:hypothetical protein